MRNEGLFRNNAIKAQANKLDGDVIVAQPVSATVLTSCLLAALAIAIVFWRALLLIVKKQFLAFCSLAQVSQGLLLPEME
ncbi:hypothetical protein SAMN04515658_11368 [Idiomarina zobellii]|nr:hypothetical protein SAMN04515658_11368 [Idiomarina zobellii]